MSGEVVIISEAGEPLLAAKLFQDYVEAQDRAKATLSIQDALVAGRAWARFLRAFEGRRPEVGGEIVSLDSRRRS